MTLDTRSAFERGVVAAMQQFERLDRMLDQFRATDRAIARFAARDPFSRFGGLDLIDAARRFAGCRDPERTRE